MAPARAAALRSPQVFVSGSALSSFFASEGQSIAVVGDQRDITQISLLNVGIPGGSYTLILQPKLGAGTLYLYDTTSPAPKLYEVCPGAATAGWYTVVSLRDNPLRLVVSIFDELGTFQGTTTYLGFGGSPLGLAVGGPSGVKYSEDARNPEGRARLLFYAGTGARHGAIWLCAEDSDGTKGDFADGIFLLEGLSAVPVRQTSWCELKARFR